MNEKELMYIFNNLPDKLEKIEDELGDYFNADNEDDYFKLETATYIHESYAISQLLFDFIKDHEGITLALADKLYDLYRTYDCLIMQYMVFDEKIYIITCGESGEYRYIFPVVVNDSLSIEARQLMNYSTLVQYGTMTMHLEKYVVECVVPYYTEESGQIIIFDEKTHEIVITVNSDVFMSDKFVNKRQYTSLFNIIDNSTTDECVLTQDEIDYIRAGQLLYTMSLETAFDDDTQDTNEVVKYVRKRLIDDFTK